MIGDMSEQQYVPSLPSERENAVRAAKSFMVSLARDWKREGPDPTRVTVMSPRSHALFFKKLMRLDRAARPAACKKANKWFRQWRELLAEEVPPNVTHPTAAATMASMVLIPAFAVLGNVASMRRVWKLHQRYLCSSRINGAEKEMREHVGVGRFFVSTFLVHSLIYSAGELQ